MTQALVIDGFEWGIAYGAPDGSMSHSSKFVTTDVGGSVGFALAAEAAAALDSTRPVRSIEFKGPKKLAIATLVKPSATPASEADATHPHGRAISLS